MLESDKYNHSRSNYLQSVIQVIQIDTQTKGLIIFTFKHSVETKLVGKEAQHINSFNH